MAAETKQFTHNLTLSPLSTPPSTSVSLSLAYRTYGDPSSPAVLLPTCYGGKLDTTLPFLFGPASENDHNPPFDPRTHFVIVLGLLGGSESSSPSNTKEPYDGARFPKVTYADNIHMQHALCESLGVKNLHAYCGFTMGGQQAYHMAVLYPDFVSNMICICGSARTSWHNWCFLEGPRSAIVNSEDFNGGEYEVPVVKGLNAFWRVYSTWALSQGWFRERCWEQLGYASLEAYLAENWGSDGGKGAWDANDLLALLATWQAGDVTAYDTAGEEVESRNGGKPGDLAKALKKVKARCLIMPCRTDAYFPVEDNEAEVKMLPDAKLSVIESQWGHLAGGGGGRKEDNAFLVNEIRKFLAT
ncbi:MAG: hypothetical protein M1828_006204 [Chrysothrix sp. TS-e1954]|nr:MAG: hypothetical protein M1828_006204 [Chrysothrix sp. TS-e1954]